MCDEQDRLQPCHVAVSWGADPKPNHNVSQQQATANHTSSSDVVKSQRYLTAAGLTGYPSSQTSGRKYPLPSAASEYSPIPTTPFSFLQRSCTVVPSSPQAVWPPPAISSVLPPAVISSMEEKVQKLISSNATLLAQSSPAMKMMLSPHDREVRRRRKRSGWDEFVWSNVYPLLRTTSHRTISRTAGDASHQQLPPIRPPLPPQQIYSHAGSLKAAAKRTPITLPRIT